MPFCLIGFAISHRRSFLSSLPLWMQMHERQFLTCALVCSSQTINNTYHENNEWMKLAAAICVRWRRQSNTSYSVFAHAFIVQTMNEGHRVNIGCVQQLTHDAAGVSKGKKGSWGSIIEFSQYILDALKSYKRKRFYTVLIMSRTFSFNVCSLFSCSSSFFIVFTAVSSLMSIALSESKLLPRPAEALHVCDFGVGDGNKMIERHINNNFRSEGYTIVYDEQWWKSQL